MSIDVDQEMHSEHRLWEADITCWRDSIAHWQHEVAETLIQLQELQKNLQQHEAGLLHHAAAIRLDELEISTHEHALAVSQRSGDPSDLPVYAAQHMKEKVRHEKQRALHEEFKQQHHEFMANWNRMLKGISLPERAKDTH